MNNKQEKIIVIHLRLEDAANKRRVKITNQDEYAAFIELIKRKLKLEKIETLVVDDQNLIIEDQDDLDCLYELADEVSIELRVNFRKDRNKKLLPLSPEKRDHIQLDEEENEDDESKEETTEIRSRRSITDEINELSISDNARRESEPYGQDRRYRENVRYNQDNSESMRVHYGSASYNNSYNNSIYPSYSDKIMYRNA